MGGSVNRERLRETFLALVGINSPPGEEAPVRLWCAERLRDAGFLCRTDPAGNLIAQKGGTIAGARPLFFCGHMDTVQPTEGLRVREVDGVFRTSGDTILGADDKAALAAILEAVAVLADSGRPHGDLLVLFTTREEVGLLGAREVAPELLHGSVGFVFDTSGVTGAIVTSAPTHDKLRVRLRGRPAHAGMSPEKGVSALEAACRGVARMRLGRVDPETTANLGTLVGGTADNIVAEHAFLTLEARSRNAQTLEEQVQQMIHCLQDAAGEAGVEVEIERHRAYSGYSWTEDDLPVRIARRAWERLGRGAPVLRPTGGGSDASVFNAWGVPTVVMSCGYLDAHTPDERVSLDDMALAAEWALAIVAESAEEPG